MAVVEGVAPETVVVGLKAVWTGVEELVLEIDVVEGFGPDNVVVGFEVVPETVVV